jgi:hypothetical protein
LGQLEGGRTQVNSGRFWNFKRDGKIYEFLIEARTNEKPSVKSYRIEKDEWLRLAAMQCTTFRAKACHADFNPGS